MLHFNLHDEYMYFNRFITWIPFVFDTSPESQASVRQRKIGVSGTPTGPATLTTAPQASNSGDDNSDDDDDDDSDSDIELMRASRRSRGGRGMGIRQLG